MTDFGAFALSPNIGVIVSAMISPIWATSILQLCTISLLSGLAGSAIGGGVDGYKDIQGFMRVLAISKKDSLAATTGITTIATLISAVQSMLFKTHYVLSRFTLPANILEIAIQAAQYEMNAVLHVSKFYSAQHSFSTRHDHSKRQKG